MSNVPQPEMRRSGHTPLVQDSKKQLAEPAADLEQKVDQERAKERRTGPPEEQRSDLEPEPETPHRPQPE